MTKNDGVAEVVVELVSSLASTGESTTSNENIEADSASRLHCYLALTRLVWTTTLLQVFSLVLYIYQTIIVHVMLR